MTAVHFAETFRNGIPASYPYCGRAPSWAHTSTQTGDVTCKWCLKKLATEEPTE